MTYIRSTQRHVSGTVSVRLHKGTATVVGRRSEHSLHSRDLMTYSAGSTFNQAAAKSFLEIYGLQAVSDAASTVGRGGADELDRAGRTDTSRLAAALVANPGVSMTEDCPVRRRSADTRRQGAARQEIAASSGIYPNVWDLIGGYVDGDESPADALRREAFEELQVAMKSCRSAIKSFQSTGHDSRPGRAGRSQRVSSCPVGAASRSTAAPDEHTEIRLVLSR